MLVTKLVYMVHSLLTKEACKFWTQSDTSMHDYHMFPPPKQNLGGHESEDDLVM
jgi:hypothetical protein